MGKTILVAVLGISVIGGFVALEAQKQTLSPEEQIARYKANERARDIAHMGYVRGEEIVRQGLVHESLPFRRVVTGRSGGGAYRCSLAVERHERLTASLVILSSYNDATHEINATLTATADTQLTASNFREWYTARHVPEEW